MSGIAGIYHPATPKPVDPARIAAMTDALAHRGPDGSGVWTGAGVGLGHRRLTIVEPAGTAQPMILAPDSTAAGELVVSYDGDIYNAHALRRELTELGARFRTAEDSELLLHGWRAWGPDLLARLDGVFALALYDATDRNLFLARDRMGVKPLHLAELSDGSVAFASELKGLLAHPLIRRAADLSAVEDFLTLGYVPDDACFVAGVRKLPAGHFLHLKRGRHLPAPTRWWDVDFSQRAKGSERDLTAELLDLMRASVRSRMAADVPLGALLSGGVDDAAVVALMAEASPQAVRTSAVAHDDAERDHAQQVASRFATDHREAIIRADDFAMIDPLVRAFDEPFADPGALATYRSYELARRGVSVALAGDGADEILAGHRRHRVHATQERARSLMPARMRAAAGSVGAIAAKAAWAPRATATATLLALAGDGDSAYATAVGVTPPALRDALYSQAARTALGGHRGEQHYLDAMAVAPAREPLDRAQYADLVHRLPGNNLTGIDRIAAAVGLEVRTPMLDHRLIAFAATLPASMRIRRGRGKWLMTRALERHLPREVLDRPATGIVPAVDAWFRGPLAEQAAALSSSRTLLETGWFSPSALARLAADHRAGRADHGRTLWQMLMLERALARLIG